MSVVRALAAVCFACALLALPAHGETYVLSTGGPPNHPWGYGARLWADLVAERTGGRIVFDVVPYLPEAGPAGTREVDGLATGAIDAAVGSSLAWAAEISPLGLFALPCLIDGPGDLEALVTSPVGERLFEAVRARGVEPLAWGDAGAWAVAARTGPLVTSAALAGLTLRAPDLPPVREALMVLGVDPVASDLAMAETQARLGMIDGMLARLADLASSARPPAGYDTWTVWPCIAEPLVFAVSDRVWSGWPLADRVVVAQAAIEAGIAQARLARSLVRRDAPWLAAAGLRLVRLTADDTGTLSLELSHIRARWAEAVGRELVLQAEQVLVSSR